MLRRHERVTLLASFYGPNAQTNAGWPRDGLFIDQNQAALCANAVGIIDGQRHRSPTITAARA